MVVRESQLGPEGPVFRGMRASHENQMAISNRVQRSLWQRFGGCRSWHHTIAVRPRGEIALQSRRPGNWLHWPR